MRALKLVAHRRRVLFSDHLPARYACALHSRAVSTAPKTPSDVRHGEHRQAWKRTEGPPTPYSRVVLNVGLLSVMVHTGSASFIYPILNEARPLRRARRQMSQHRIRLSVMHRHKAKVLLPPPLLSLKVSPGAMVRHT